MEAILPELIRLIAARLTVVGFCELRLTARRYWRTLSLEYFGECYRKYQYVRNGLAEYHDWKMPGARYHGTTTIYFDGRLAHLIEYYLGKKHGPCWRFQWEEGKFIVELTEYYHGIRHGYYARWVDDMLTICSTYHYGYEIWRDRSRIEINQVEIAGQIITRRYPDRTGVTVDKYNMILSTGVSEYFDRRGRLRYRFVYHGDGSIHHRRGVYTKWWPSGAVRSEGHVSYWGTVNKKK